MRGSAEFSECGLYRYMLTREWADLLASQRCVFVLLNPSTADAEKDDPTIRRCVGYARQWGFGSLAVLNIFAYRSTDPTNLLLMGDPVGPKNREFFVRTLGSVPLPFVVCAWGRWGYYRDQGRQALGWIKKCGCEPMALQVNKDGQPGHPLYLRKDLVPKPL